MVTVNIAYTAPINPTDVQPVLTQDQVWTGLKRKVRRAYEFVPVITSCEVLAEETSGGCDKITRHVVFAPGSRPNDDGKPVREVCVEYAPCRVDFQQDDGSSISNVVSKGAEGELLMTYVFEWRHPGVAEGSEGHKKLEEMHWKTAKMAVQGSIDTIRRFVNSGQIQ